MFRTTLRQLMERKLRLLTTGVAIALGVAFMAGTLILTDTLERSFGRLFADANAGRDAYVRSDVVSPDGQRSRLDAALLADVRAVPGVAAAHPAVEGFAQLVDGDPAAGRSWTADDRLNPFELVDGRAPATDDEIVVDRATATSERLGVGDAVDVLTPDGVHAFRVAGVVTFGGTDDVAGSGVVLFTEQAAQVHLAAPGKVDGIAVAAADGVGQRELAARIARVLPAGAEAITGAQLSEENRSDVQESLSFFNTFLVVFALISLFVGSFIIFNTFSILVAQRSRQSALLRALGASRRQVLGSVVLEAAAIGVVASVAGLAIGAGVAAGLRSALGAMGVELPDVPLVLARQTVVVALAAGIVVTVASAILPARRAARVAPVAAMRGAATEPATPGRGRVAAGLAVTGLGVAAMASGLAGAGDGSSAVATVGTGAAVVFLGVALLGPVIARPVSRVLGSPLPSLRGVAGTLARENALRNPRRTSTTAAALMVGVALVGFITILASSTKASIASAIGASFTGDVVVQPRMMGGGLDAALASDLRALPEVDRALGVRSGHATLDGATVELAAGPAAELAGLFDLGSVEGSFAGLGADGVAVAAAEAERLGLEVGDVVDLTFVDGGPKTMRIGAVYEEDELVGSWLLDLPAYEASFLGRLDDRIFVSKADGTTDAEVLAAVGAVVDRYPGAEAQDRAAFTGEQTAAIDSMVNVVYALLALAVVIALLGITNTLALSILERTRELGLLRAVGMARSQLRSMIRWEAALVALLGTTMGLTIGLGFAWAVVRALQAEGITHFTVPGEQLAVITVLAATAGVAAAIVPARRAARMQVLGAVAS
jgi:putative ABC transport system permease protein